MSEYKTYLGDSAYAEIDEGGDVVLTTENGISTTNRIVLGDSEYAALTTFVNRFRQERFAAELGEDEGADRSLGPGAGTR